MKNITGLLTSCDVHISVIWQPKYETCQIPKSIFTWGIIFLNSNLSIINDNIRYSNPSTTKFGKMALNHLLDWGNTKSKLSNMNLYKFFWWLHWLRELNHIIVYQYPFRCVSIQQHEIEPLFYLISDLFLDLHINEKINSNIVRYKNKHLQTKVQCLDLWYDPQIKNNFWYKIHD